MSLAQRVRIGGGVCGSGGNAWACQLVELAHVAVAHRACDSGQPGHGHDGRAADPAVWRADLGCSDSAWARGGPVHFAALLVRDLRRRTGELVAFDEEASLQGGTLVIAHRSLDDPLRGSRCLRAPGQGSAG